MKKALLIALLTASALASGCVASCPTYQDNRRYRYPLHKPTFKQDWGHQKHKFSHAPLR